ncbi:putative carbonic anhydrase 2 [Gigantopelta aegis]|uniref:putative carbonic anhydrase 2 n=1 Tax=Gigantopelta aegis TaxID=1735272 RepID=UPI001B8892CE|nr:putative carbonic anhydrase 2 [Gigantopelta aegis]
MAELQHRLKNSLKLQGVPVKSPPPRNRPVSAPVKVNSQSDDSKQGKNNARRDQPRRNDRNEAKDKMSEFVTKETVRQDGSSDRLNSGSRSPRRNYGRGQSSPQRFSADGRPRSDRGQRGRGDGYRGRGGEGGGRWLEDGRGRGRDRRGGRGRGEYRGGRGMPRDSAAPVQSSQSNPASVPSSAATTTPPSATGGTANPVATSLNPGSN